MEIHSIKNEIINHSGGSFFIRQIFHIGHTPINIFSWDIIIMITIKIIIKFSNKGFGGFETMLTIGWGFWFNIFKDIHINEFLKIKGRFFFIIFFWFKIISFNDFDSSVMGQPFEFFYTFSNSLSINFS